MRNFFSIGWLLLSLGGFAAFGASNIFSVPAIANKPPLINPLQDISAKVAAAFDNVRKGNYALSNELTKDGDKIFPFIKPYLQDKEVKVRYEVIRLFFDVGGENSLPSISEGLANDNPEVKIYTANNLYLRNRFAQKRLILGESSEYKNFTSEKIKTYPAIGEALRKNLKDGSGNQQSIFLLANFPSSETEKTLTDAVSSSPTMLKPNDLLAAQIVLARSGDAPMVQQLTKIAVSGNTPELVFLLESIYEIEAKEVLAALSQTLNNKTLLTKGRPDNKVHEKLPAGAWVEYPAARRLCDLAVNKFVEKFELRPSFDLHTTVYTDKQILEIKNKLKKLKIFADNQVNFSANLGGR